MAGAIRRQRAGGGGVQHRGERGGQGVGLGERLPGAREAPDVWRQAPQDIHMRRAPSALGRQARGGPEDPPAVPALQPHADLIRAALGRAVARREVVAGERGALFACRVQVAVADQAPGRQPQQPRHPLVDWKKVLGVFARQRFQRRAVRAPTAEQVTRAVNVAAVDREQVVAVHRAGVVDQGARARPSGVVQGQDDALEILVLPASGRADGGARRGACERHVGGRGRKNRQSPRLSLSYRHPARCRAMKPSRGRDDPAYSPRRGSHPLPGLDRLLYSAGDPTSGAPA